MMGRQKVDQSQLFYLFNLEALAIRVWRPPPNVPGACAP